MMIIIIIIIIIISDLLIALPQNPIQQGLKALLDGVDTWMGDHLDKSPLLYSLGSQAGIADINRAFHIYYKCFMWVEFQLIST